MAEILSKVIKSSSIYVVGKIINSILPLIFIPILTSELNPSEYGILVYFTSIISFCIPLIILNAPTTYTFSFYKDKHLKNLLFQLFFISILGCLILSLIFFLTFSNLVEFNLFEKHIFIVPLFVLTLFFPDIFLVHAQLEKKPIVYATFQIFQTLINFLLSIYFLFISDLGWISRIYGWGLANLFFSCISFYILFKNHKFNLFTLNLNGIKKNFLFGFNLLPHALSSLAIMVSGRICLGSFGSSEELGYFGLGFQIASVLSFLTASINNAIAPEIYETFKSKNMHKINTLLKLSLYYFFILIIFGVLISFIFPLIFNFLNPSYKPALKFSLILVWGFIFLSFISHSAHGFIFYGKTRLQSKISTFIIIPSTFFLVVFTKLYGALGTSLVFVLTLLFYCIINCYFSLKIIRKNII